MKYVRTKDGRILRLNEASEKFFEGKKIFLASTYEELQQADTIEELSDAYVIVPKDKKFKPYTLDTLSGFDDIEAVLEHNDIYSSIWVNALLKPVAKMNEKGDLCLI